MMDEGDDVNILIPELSRFIPFDYEKKLKYKGLTVFKYNPNPCYNGNITMCPEEGEMFN